MLVSEEGAIGGDYGVVEGLLRWRGYGEVGEGCEVSVFWTGSDCYGKNTVQKSLDIEHYEQFLINMQW